MDRPQDISERVAKLPREKRQLLERLLAKEGLTLARHAPAGADGQADSGPAAGGDAGTRGAGSPRPGGRPLSFISASAPGDAKAAARQFYDSVTEQLDSAAFGKYSFFLNFGYVPDASPQHSAISLPDRYLNKNCVKLVLEVIGDCPLEGRAVLDVGCGRGGTIHVIRTFFKPSVTVGLDLSRAAVAFCDSTHRYPGAAFLVGDAESLPFRDESFDVVTNVESSHSYPDVTRFYAEVFRVLKKGGCFLYTDLLPGALLGSRVGALKDLGFAVEADRDITANVLLSCDETARVHRQAFRQDNDREVLDNFLGVPSSVVYKEMETRRSTYRIFKLRKHAGA